MRSRREHGGRPWKVAPRPGCSTVQAGLDAVQPEELGAERNRGEEGDGTEASKIVCDWPTGGWECTVIGWSRCAECPRTQKARKKRSARPKVTTERLGESRSIDRQHCSAHAVHEMSKAERKNANHLETTASETGTSTQRGNRVGQRPDDVSMIVEGRAS